MIYVFLADGFEETEAICPLDILRRAGLEVYTVSVSGRKSVLSSRKIPVEADLLLEELTEKTPEGVVLPGGMPGAKNLNSGSAKNGAGLRRRRRSGGCHLRRPLHSGGDGLASVQECHLLPRI